jgi:hypothetical protein
MVSVIRQSVRLPTSGITIRKVTSSARNAAPTTELKTNSVPVVAHNFELGGGTEY